MFDRNPNKKSRRAQEKKNRVAIPFNTGTRTHKTKKDYDRKNFKRETRKEIEKNF